MEISRLEKESDALEKSANQGHSWSQWFAKLAARKRFSLRGKKDPEKGRRVSPLWKRFIDIGIPIIAFPLLAPIFLFICVWIKLTSKGSVFYTQNRIGFNREEFVFFKFRSMSENAKTDVHDSYLEHLIESDEKMTKLDDLGDKRLIPGGNMLRSLGFDELPQLINVFRGEMSLIGPRPCTESEFEHYKADQMHRFDALPGISGYWQVKGKNETTFSEMIEMDEFYVDHVSPVLDLLIVVRTPAILFLQLIDLIELRICRSKQASSEEKKDSSEREKIEIE